MVLSFLRSKEIVFPAYVSCWTNKTLVQPGFLSGIHESLMPRELVAKALPFMRSSKFWIVAACGLFAACFMRIERIPFTKRFHVVLSNQIMNRLAEFGWKETIDEYTQKMLPSDQPESILAASIAERIVEAMNPRLMLDKGFKMNGHINDGMAKICKHTFLVTESGKLVLQSPPRQKLAWKLATKHLDRGDWKVHVLDSYGANAFCVFDRQRIFVCKRLLPCDIRWHGDIAAVIGHEIGHVIARHVAEQFALLVGMVVALALFGSWKKLAFAILMPLIDGYFNRRCEEEADYIGLMLMASAGYDPRIAPIYFTKLGEIADYPHIEPKYLTKLRDKVADLLSSHPPADMRAKLLNKAKVMEEALELYNEAKANGRARGLARKLNRFMVGFITL